MMIVVDYRELALYIYFYILYNVEDNNRAS